MEKFRQEWEVIRWRKVWIFSSIAAAMVTAVFIILTRPIIGCTDYYPDGTEITHYGKECLEPPEVVIPGQRV